MRFVLADDRVTWLLIAILFVAFVGLAGKIVFIDKGIDLRPDPPLEECEEHYDGLNFTSASYTAENRTEWGQAGFPPMLSCITSNGTEVAVMCYDGCGTDKRWK